MCTASTIGPQPGDSVIQAALSVLQQPDPRLKAEHTRVAVSLWKSGQLNCTTVDNQALSAPDRPARDDAQVSVFDCCKELDDCASK